MSQIFDYLGGTPRDKSDQLNDPLVQQDNLEDPPGQQTSPKSERPGHFRQLWSEVKGALHDEWFSGGEADEGIDQASGDDGQGGAFDNLKEQLDKDLKSKLLHDDTEAARKASNERASLMEDLKEKLEPHLRFKERDFLTFEPRGFKQNLNSWTQNTKEVLILVAAIGVSLAFPTIETIVYILIAAVNTWIANYNNKNRLVFGMALSYIQLCWVLAVIFAKATKFSDSRFTADKITSERDLHEQMKIVEAFGGKVYDIVHDAGSDACDLKSAKDHHGKTNSWKGCFSFKVDLWESCIPDFIFLFLFLVYLWSQYKAYHRRENAIEKRINILLIKNYELQVKEDEEDVAAGVGTNKQRAAAAEQERAEALKKYNEEMTKECQRFDRSFLSAKAFNNQNKPVFALMLFVQLISSLSFNALIDIPTFAVLVVIKGAFPFRKNSPIAYGYLTFFTSYYVKYLSIIKIVYVVITQLPMFRWFLRRYAKDPTVEKVTLLFGLNFTNVSLLKKATGAAATERYLALEYYGFVVAGLALAIMWQQMKFAQAREFCLSQGQKKSSLYYYFRKLHKQKLVNDMITANLKKDFKKQMEKGNTAEAIEEKKIYKQKKRNFNKKSKFQKMKAGINRYLPFLVMWCMRVMVGLQAYMYCNAFGLLHITWVLLSFCLPNNVTFFISSVFMIPIYTFEFCMVYLGQSSFVKQHAWFQQLGGPTFSREFKFPLLEQLLFYLIMAGFWLMTSATYLSIEHEQNKTLKTEFFKRLEDPTKSKLWKFSFYIFRYIQLLVLLTLFIFGEQHIDLLPNLVYICAFVVYTTYERLYRKSSILLIVFLALQIFGQYFFGLKYHMFIEHPVEMNHIAWLGLTRCHEYSLDNIQTMTWQALREKCAKQHATFPTWHKEVDGKPQSIYFRQIPFWQDILILIIMSALHQINYFYKDQREVTKIQSKVYDLIRQDDESGKKGGEKSTNYVYVVIRILNFLQKNIKFFCIGLMFYFNAIAETNIITSIFFCQMCVLMAFIAKADGKRSTNKWLVRVTQGIKSWTAFITIVDVLFISAVGQHAKTGPNAVGGKKSADQRLREFCPFIYRNLNIIGLRNLEDPFNPLTSQAEAKRVMIKFQTYIIYLVASIYLYSHYTHAKKMAIWEAQAQELDYQRLFEFGSYKIARTEKELQEEKDEEARKEHDIPAESSDGATEASHSDSDSEISSRLRGAEEDEDDAMYMERRGARIKAIDELRQENLAKDFPKCAYKVLNYHEEFDLRHRAKVSQDLGAEGSFKIKLNYVSYDLKDRYEEGRYSIVFWVSKHIHWWPYLDLIASYGNIVVNLITVQIAISLSVSFYMALNIFLMCAYYALFTIRIQKRAYQTLRLSGLQSQTDINNASIVTRQYKTGAFYEALKLRLIIWRIQMFACAICVSIGFPTTILWNMRQIYKYDFAEDPVKYASNKSWIDGIDAVNYWCFVTGIFKDPEPGVSLYFYATFGLMYVGLFLEKAAIDWLTNRWGCTYNKLQKLIELEERYKLIDEHDITHAVPYCPQRYRDHYFYHNFDEIIARTTENDADANIKRKVARDEANHLDKEVRDFIPYKIAMRIKAMVQFSTRLDARLEVKDQTKQKEQLEIWERCRTQKLTKIQTIEGEQFARTKKLRAAEKKIKRKLKDRLLRKGLSDQYKCSKGHPMEHLFKHHKSELPADCPAVECHTCSASKNKDDKGNVDPAIKVADGYYHCPTCQDENYHDQCAQELSTRNERCKYQEEHTRLIAEAKEALNNIAKIWEAEGEYACNMQHVPKREDTGSKTRDILKNPLDHYDYEEIDILKKHKIKSLHTILENAISTKYKISFYKGVQIFVENVTMLILMISITLKSNQFSLIYLAFIYKYIFVVNKTSMLVRMTGYISVCLTLQYMLFVLNLTPEISPQQYPRQFADYPYGPADEGGKKIPYTYAVPVFFQLSSSSSTGKITYMFQDLKLGYFAGIGIAKSQLQSLFLDFVNLYLVSMYVLNFRNPLLNVQMRKCFWQFPNVNDSKEKWARLDPLVKKQVNWLISPTAFKDPAYKDVHEKLTRQSKSAEHHADDIYHFQDKQKNLGVDLNYILTTYVDLKYTAIWSADFLKEIKWEIKRQSLYFRLVKQGSIFIYLSFHVFTILVILFMAVLRQSYMSFGYVFLILPRIREGAHVLKQNLIELDKEITNLEDAIKQRGDDLKKMDEDLEKLHRDEEKAFEKRREENELAEGVVFERSEESDDKKEERQKITREMEDLTKELNDIHLNKKGTSDLTPDQKRDEKELKKQKNWKIIKLVQTYLLYFCVFDFTLQVLAQMSYWPKSYEGRMFGLRKIYTNPNEHQAWNYQYFEDGKSKYRGYVFDAQNFAMQVLNCYMICIISFQSQIFNSYGYKKFITQKDGSMDLLVQLSILKAKSMAYIYNNNKIKKIVVTQGRREQILANVAELKKKMSRWRQWTKACLDVKTEAAEKAEREQVRAVVGAEVDKKRQLDEVLLKKTQQDGRTEVGGAHHGVNKDFSMDAISETPEDDDKSHKSANSSQEEDKEDKDQERVIGGELKAIQENKDIGLSTKRTLVLEIKKSYKEKKVAFEEEKERRELETDDLDDKRQRISQEQAQPIFDLLQRDLVKAKMEDMNVLTKIYQYLNKTFVERIMLENRREKLIALNQSHAAGSVETPTELETMIREEAMFVVKERFDHLAGSEELYRLLQMMNQPGAKDKNILQKTGMNKSVKLSQLTNTYRFTRPGSMLLKLGETLFYIGISQVQNLIYLSFIFSMMQNSGLISLVYPVSMFGYALIEEVRPRKWYWGWIRTYTIGVLVIKFLITLHLVRGLLMANDDTIGYIKPGLYVYTDMWQNVVYMAPEILITGLIMLNEIRLKLYGLYYVIELDIESVQEGIQRHLAKGDLDIVRLRKIQNANMDIHRLFAGSQDQKKLRDEQEEAAKTRRQEKTAADMEKKLLGQKVEPDEPIVHYSMETKQRDILKGVCKDIHKSSFQFDLNTFGYTKNPAYTEMIAAKTLKKSLESDYVIYVEGTSTIHADHEFLTRDELEDQIRAELETYDYSACDFKEEYHRKNGLIEYKQSPHLGAFERWDYFKRIFPSENLQKPGYDLYASTNVVLFILLFFVFSYFGKIAVDIDMLFRGNSNIFRGNMVVCLLSLIFLIILERYMNRSNTFEKKQSIVSQEEQSSFFSKQQMFARTSTERSMTVKLNTMKTSSFDLGSGAAQAFLDSLGGDGDADGDLMKGSGVKITKQQKAKWFTHWLVILIVHAFVFWIFPIVGNYQLYRETQCPKSEIKAGEQLSDKGYGCMTFHANPYLHVLYLLFCAYLMLSAFQIKHGFPQMRRPSSVMQYNDNQCAFIMSQVYYSVPLVVETRTIIDFTFATTALDAFQNFQLFQYHFDMYSAKNSNVWYTQKKIGEKTEMLDKCILGWLIGILVFAILIGPLVIFSNIGGFVSPNHVIGGQVYMSFIVNHNYTADELSKLDPEFNSTQLQSLDKTGRFSFDKKSSKSTPTKPIDNKGDEKMSNSTYEKHYNIYTDKNPLFGNFTRTMYDESAFHKYPQTRFFSADQVQSAVLGEFADDRWYLSAADHEILNSEIHKSMNMSDSRYNMSFGLHGFWDRRLPPAHKRAHFKDVKTLDPTKYADCLTRQQLLEFASFKCPAGQQLYAPSNAERTIRFSQVFNPNELLGATSEVMRIWHKVHFRGHSNQKKDVTVRFQCPDQWSVFASENDTEIANATHHAATVVDQETCETRLQKATRELKGKNLNETMIAKGLKDLHLDLSPEHQEQLERISDAGAVTWVRVRFTLFSMLASSGFFAGYSVTTFYAGVVLVLGTTIRSALINDFYKAWQYETTMPDAIIKLCEAVVLHRQEVNPTGEEECYRMLQEIVRSVELHKALTGSSLRGSLDPVYDTIRKQEDKDQLLLLEDLERKGFDVSKKIEQLRVLNDIPDPITRKKRPWDIPT